MGTSFTAIVMVDSSISQSRASGRRTWPSVDHFFSPGGGAVSAGFSAFASRFAVSSFVSCFFEPRRASRCQALFLVFLSLAWVATSRSNPANGRRAWVGASGWMVIAPPAF